MGSRFDLLTGKRDDGSFALAGAKMRDERFCSEGLVCVVATSTKAMQLSTAMNVPLLGHDHPALDVLSLAPRDVHGAAHACCNIFSLSTERLEPSNFEAFPRLSFCAPNFDAFTERKLTAETCSCWRPCRSLLGEDAVEWNEARSFGGAFIEASEKGSQLLSAPGCPHPCGWRR